MGLVAGGDDYITKPFSPREIVARVKAHLRRYRMAVEANTHGGGSSQIPGPGDRPAGLHREGSRREKCTCLAKSMRYSSSWHKTPIESSAPDGNIREALAGTEPGRYPHRDGAYIEHP